MPTTLALYQLLLAAGAVLQNNNTSEDFTDLGRKLLGGFVLGVVVAVAFALIKIRLREKHPPAKFISITAPAAPDEAAKTGD